MHKISQRVSSGSINLSIQCHLVPPGVGRIMSRAVVTRAGPGFHSDSDAADPIYKHAIPLLPLLSSFDGIFIDDAFDIIGSEEAVAQSQVSPLVVVEDFLLVTFSLVNESQLLQKTTIWAASDRTTVFGNTTSSGSRLREVLNWGRKEKRLDIRDGERRVTTLGRVMRMPVDVFRIAYQISNQQLFFVKPSAGHKVHGTLKRISIQCRGIDDAMTKIWARVKKIINGLSAQRVSLDHVAIIVGGYQKYAVTLQNFLYEKCEEGSIPAGHIRDLSGATTYNNVAATDRSTKSGIVRIYGPPLVSSMEWPFVIFVAYLADNKECSLDDYRLIDYGDYVSRSRATAGLYEIFAVDISKRHNHYRRYSEPCDYFGDRKHFKPISAKGNPPMANTATPRHDIIAADLCHHGCNDTMQRRLRNLAGGTALLTGISNFIKRLPSQFPAIYDPDRPSEYYRTYLWNITRRRHFTACELDMTKRTNVLPDWLKEEVQSRRRKAAAGAEEKVDLILLD